ncbi:MAG: hypothetical protein AAFX09_10185 [Pseudomonadota bacterium]
MTALGAAGAAAQHPHLPAALPPSDALPGECFQRVRIEAVYDTIRETVSVADSYEEYLVSPAILDMISRDYVRREAGMRYIVTEPVYQTITEEVLVRPGYTEYDVIPARHETVTERVLVREGRMVWRRGYVEGARAVRHDPETGDIWCLVEEPAEYRNVHRTVVTQPAQLIERPVPAQYDTITREVLVEPARVEEVPIPAEHASYTSYVLTSPAGVETRFSEAREDIIERYELISGERYEWRVVDCEDLEIPGFGHPMGGGYSSSSHSSSHSSGYSSSSSHHSSSHTTTHHSPEPDPSASTPDSRFFTVPSGKSNDEPDFDYEAYEASPVASLNAHPGRAAADRFARQR